MWSEENKEINGLFFKQTCVIAPEQYDVYLNNRFVAYVRCRWGKLRVHPIKSEFILDNLHTISDEDYDNLNNWEKIDFDNVIYSKIYTNHFKSDIPEEEFEKITNAIYKYLKDKEGI